MSFYSQGLSQGWRRIDLRLQAVPERKAKPLGSKQRG